jgi:hypothetical protein
MTTFCSTLSNTDKVCIFLPCVSNTSQNNAISYHRRVGTDTGHGCVICEVGTELRCTALGGLTSTNMSSNTREVWKSPEKPMTFVHISESNGEKVL